MKTLSWISAFALQTRLGLEITSPRWTTNPQPKTWKASSSVPCLNPLSPVALQLRMNCTALRIWWEVHLFFPQGFLVSALRKVLSHCHEIDKLKSKSLHFKVKISLFPKWPVARGEVSVTHFSSLLLIILHENGLIFLFYLIGSVVIAEIVARYFEPLKRKRGWSSAY